jgi:hypothetical protein
LVAERGKSAQAQEPDHRKAGGRPHKWRPPIFLREKVAWNGRANAPRVSDRLLRALRRAIAFTVEDSEAPALSGPGGNEMKIRNDLRRSKVRQAGATITLTLFALGATILSGWQWRIPVRATGRASCPTITFTANLLPVITVGTPTNLTLSATGGAPAYKYALTGGAVPDGMTLAVSGALSGAPTQPGVYSFTITATDKMDCKGSQAYQLTVKGCPAVTIQPGLLPSTQVNTPYNATLTASGHVAPYTFALSSGALPAGLSLSAAGALSGTPAQAGQFSFSAAATSSAGCKGGRGYAIRVNPILKPQQPTP